MIVNDSRQKIDGLTVTDSITEEEFQNLVKFFAILMEIDQRQKDAMGDSNSEEVPHGEDLK